MSYGYLSATFGKFRKRKTCFTAEEIAPLFADSIGLDNIILPEDFVEAMPNSIG